MIYLQTTVLHSEDLLYLHCGVFTVLNSRLESLMCLEELSGEWKREHCINRLEFQKGLYQARYVVDLIQQVCTNSGKGTNGNSLHLPQIAMKIAKNTVPPLSNKWVT